MTKFRRIINGECSFQMIELFDDAKKAANNSNSGEFVECKINNLKIDFTTVKKEQDGKSPIASAEAKGSSSKKA
tara:strand:+ start:353 stop:574 length:222 start_codon:yes stop_codon:yes gene_type:complete